MRPSPRAASHTSAKLKLLLPRVRFTNVAGTSTTRIPRSCTATAISRRRMKPRPAVAPRWITRTDGPRSGATAFVVARLGESATIKIVASGKAARISAIGAAMFSASP